MRVAAGALPCGSRGVTSASVSPHHGWSCSSRRSRRSHTPVSTCCSPANQPEEVHTQTSEHNPPRAPMLHLQELQSSNKVKPSASNRPLIAKVSSIGTKALINFTDQGICSCCRGSGSVTCAPCSGSGWLSKGGYNKKNPIPKEIINSKWSSMQETIGWRHFRVIQQRKSGNLVFLRMQASCDPSAQIWVNKEALRDRSQWAAGWLQRSEMLNTGSSSNGGGDDGDAGGATSLEGGGTVVDAQPSAGKLGAPASPPPNKQAKLCRTCAGTGKVVCKQCDASGVVLINL